MSSKKGKDWFQGIIRKDRKKPFEQDLHRENIFDDDAPDDLFTSAGDELVYECRRIELLALDVDGVLTDGTINIGESGEIFKGFNVKDGLAISLALRSGLNIAIITGRRSAIIHRRAEELGISLLYEGVTDKYAVLTELARSLNLKKEQVAYMGDDINDLPAFAAAGYTFAPADAADYILETVDIYTIANGGRGAVREVIEFILQCKGKWPRILKSYMQHGQGDKQ